VAIAGAGCSQGSQAQTSGAAVSFKLGTFERDGRAFVRLVLRFTQVIDIAEANRSVERHGGKELRS
jgi:hypothetical protein